MKLLRTFRLPLHGHPATVEALISYTSYDILNVTGRAGRKLDVTCDDLDTIEAHIDSQIQTTETEAYSFTSGRMERFQIVSHLDAVLAVIDVGGYSLPCHDPQFTEAAEAWALDHEFEMVNDSDVPEMARAYGYPPCTVEPAPEPSAYRRAA